MEIAHLRSRVKLEGTQRMAEAQTVGILNSINITANLKFLGESLGQFY